MDDGASQYYPQCLLYTKADMDAKRPLIVFTDIGVRTALMDDIADVLRKKYSPLIGPDTTVTQRNDGGGAHRTRSASTREAQLRAQKAFIPLRRAVHNDCEKLAKITHAATELKLTDHSLAVNIRNLHSESGIQNLGALRTTSIPHLLGFQFSVEPGFTGTAKTLDSLDMSNFIPVPKNGSRFEFRTIAEQFSAFEHLKRVLMGVMLEPRSSKRPLFGRIFQPLIDALRDTDMNTRLGFLPIVFIVRKCNHMVMEWSKLYSNDNNEHLPYEDFLALNEAALTIPVTEWLYLGRNQPLIPRQNQIPGKHFVESQTDDYNSKKQRVNPTTPTAGGNAAPKGGGKYGKKKQQQTSSAAPKTIKPTAPPAAKPTQVVCIKSHLHQVNAAAHPGDCTIATYTRKHNAIQNNGKLSKPDKESVRSYIDGRIPGPFADKRKITFDTYL